jgi:hypothetical protein
MRRLILALFIAALSCVGASAQDVRGPFSVGSAGRAAFGLAPDTGVAPRRSTLTIGFASNMLSNSLSAASNNTYLYAVPYPAEATVIRVLVPLITAVNGANGYPGFQTMLKYIIGMN